MSRQLRLASFRKGWENENLAGYLLSRFCFIAQPSTVSDDLGSDFYCTTFERRGCGREKHVVPRSSFAIQIKSNGNPIDVSSHVPYLRDLQIPFFVGVCDQKSAKLTIYSGEYLPMQFSLNGAPASLKIVLCERDRKSYFYKDETEEDSWVICFPKVAAISCETEASELADVSMKITGICAVMQANIASKTAKEYSFLEYSGKNGYVFAGKESAEVFLFNFCKRLCEVFHNLVWLYENKSPKFSADEFRLYDSLVRDMCALYGEDRILQPVLSEPLYKLRNWVAASLTGSSGDGDS